MWIPGLGRYKPAAGNRVGDAAPDFTLPDQDGKPVHLAEQLRAGPVALVFYPRAGTPVCTRQMCSLREGWTELMQRAHVFGISYDGMPALKLFQQAENLPFSLLSDEDRIVSRAYGVAGWFVAARVTFVIGAGGLIRAVIEHIKAGDHAAQVMAALTENAA